jgi:hypothetical protein
VVRLSLECDAAAASLMRSREKQALNQTVSRESPNGVEVCLWRSGAIRAKAPQMPRSSTGLSDASKQTASKGPASTCKLTGFQAAHIMRPSFKLENQGREEEHHVIYVSATVQTEAEARAWFSKANEHKKRTQGIGAAPGQRPGKADRLGSRPSVGFWAVRAGSPASPRFFNERRAPLTRRVRVPATCSPDQDRHE